MGFKGLDDELAPQLASAITVTGGAYSVQGQLVEQILNKWSIDADLDFRRHQQWAVDEVKHLNWMLKRTREDPSATIHNAALAGVLETWFKYGSLTRAVKISTGAEAAMRLYGRWQQGKNVAAARSALALSRTISGLGSEEYTAGRRALTEALTKAKAAQNAFKEPWAWQKVLGKVAGKFKSPFPSKVTAILQKANFLKKVPTNMPGAGIANKVMLPLAVAHGVTEMFSPGHDGAQGWIDRGMGGLEVAGVGAVVGGSALATTLGATATVAAAVPVVGWAALGVTGAYFLGTWAWDRWGDDVKGWGKKAGKAVGKWAKGTYDDVKNDTEGIVEGAKKVVKNVVPGPLRKFAHW
ncbi:hypothetical protein [Streptomyces sp. NRRL F-5630]|uniref:hypothetical protein n=1 Tax=Streptomyces sp. NRRL F-5630 TaxID=1463864 RepID=UPI003EB6A601